MKSSHRFFLIGASLFFFFILGGFNPYLSWEQRLIKVAIVGLFSIIAWIIKSSQTQEYKTRKLVLLLLLAGLTGYTLPRGSHLLKQTFYKSHAYFSNVNGKQHIHNSNCDN